MISRPCFACGATVGGEDLNAYGLAGLAHVRAEHADIVPYPDMAVRNYFEGEARMTGGAERLETIGNVEIHPVTEDRVDDFLAFMDFDAMVGVPQNSACYCLEPHELSPGEPLPEGRHWTARREEMRELFANGTAFGYLAYVDGKAAGWVNASKRCDYSLFRRGDEDDARTVGVACFAIAPPYRHHGLAPRLLARVIEDAKERDVDFVEAYPINDPDRTPFTNFRGNKGMYDVTGFDTIKVRTNDTVVRRPV